MKVPLWTPRAEIDFWGRRGGGERRDEGQAEACDVDGNGRGILMAA